MAQQLRGPLNSGARAALFDFVMKQTIRNLDTLMDLDPTNDAIKVARAKLLLTPNSFQDPQDKIYGPAQPNEARWIPTFGQGEHAASCPHRYGYFYSPCDCVPGHAPAKAPERSVGAGPKTLAGLAAAHNDYYAGHDPGDETDYRPHLGTHPITETRCDFAGCWCHTGAPATMQKIPMTQQMTNNFRGEREPAWVSEARQRAQLSPFDQTGSPSKSIKHDEGHVVDAIIMAAREVVNPKIDAILSGPEPVQNTPPAMDFLGEWKSRGGYHMSVTTYDTSNGAGRWKGHMIAPQQPELATTYWWDLEGKSINPAFDLLDRIRPGKQYR